MSPSTDRRMRIRTAGRRSARRRDRHQVRPRQPELAQDAGDPSSPVAGTWRTGRPAVGIGEVCSLQRLLPLGELCSVASVTTPACRVSQPGGATGHAVGELHVDAGPRRVGAPPRAALGAGHGQHPDRPAWIWSANSPARSSEPDLAAEQRVSSSPPPCRTRVHLFGSTPTPCHQVRGKVVRSAGRRAAAERDAARIGLPA